MGMNKFFQHLLKILPEDDINNFINACNINLNKSIRFFNRVSKTKKVIGYSGDTYKISSKIEWDQNGFYLDQFSRPSKSIDYIKGDFYIQEAASMYPVGFLYRYLNENTYENNNLEDNNSYILDYSASPGGKTVQIADCFPDSVIISNDVIKSRIGALYSNIIRSKLFNIVLLNEDFSFFENNNLMFDIILADLPCSNETLIYKNKKKIEDWNLKEVLFNSKRQKKICANLINLCKSEGLFLYSTCTFSVEENEQIVDFIVKNNFSLIHQKRLWPHKDNCAGGFSSLLKSSTKQNSSFSVNQDYIYENTDKIFKILSKLNFFDYQKIKKKGYLYQKQNYIYLFSFPKILKKYYDNAVIFGLPIAKIENYGILPLFNAVDLANEQSTIKITKDNLEKLSKGEDLQDKNIGNLNRFIVFANDDCPIFLVKASSNGVKNLIPSNMIIR